MYRRNIDVVIASRSENLAQLIADAPMDKGISISATKTDATMLKNHPNCDILICDFDQLELDSVEKHAQAVQLFFVCTKISLNDCRLRFWLK